MHYQSSVLQVCIQYMYLFLGQSQRISFVSLEVLQQPLLETQLEFQHCSFSLLVPQQEEEVNQLHRNNKMVNNTSKSLHNLYMSHCTCSNTIRKTEATCTSPCLSVHVTVGALLEIRVLHLYMQGTQEEPTAVSRMQDTVNCTCRHQPVKRFSVHFN